MPVCCRNAAAWGPKIFRMGTSASLCGLWSTLNGKVIQLTGKKPAEAIKEKAIYSKPVTPYHRRVKPREKWLPSAAVVLPLPAQRAWRRKEKSHWSNLVFKTVSNRRNHYQTQRTDFVLFAWWAQAWLCSRRTSHRAWWHRAAVLLIASPTALPPVSLPRCDIQATPCWSCLPKIIQPRLGAQLVEKVRLS